jgi:hypothetical protein
MGGTGMRTALPSKAGARRLQEEKGRKSKDCARNRTKLNTH